MILPHAKIAEDEPNHPSHAAPEKRPAQLVCEMAEAGAFSPHLGRMHGPVLAAFGGGTMHQCGMDGSYDLQKLISIHSRHLFRSIQRFHAKEETLFWDDLTFRMSAHAFVYADESRIIACADTAQTAEQLARQFHEDGLLPPVPRGGSYRLIRTGRDISTQNVPLSPDTVLDDARLSLHYGPGFVEWHQQYLGLLRRHRHGLSLLEGPPGTGKTSYLRHLMGALTETHRFYFVPNGSLSVLTHPEFVGFWADQRRRHDKENFVVILEDSDTAILARGPDNRDQVSAILNLSDGMLADFLRLQIICTINCRASDIDPALLRPGRLLTHRLFDRLPHAAASSLAAHLGKTLPGHGDYSLAEIYADETHAPPPARVIGFAVFENRELVASPYWLIKPPRGHGWFLEEWTEDIHGISWSDVRDKPGFDGIAAEMLSHLEAADLVVAHNASFDLRVLHALLEHFEIPAPPFQHQCTLHLARQTWPHLPNHQLNTLAAYLGIDLNHHHAQSDAIAAGRLMLVLKRT